MRSVQCVLKSGGGVVVSLKRRDAKVAEQRTRRYTMLLGGILYSLSLMLVMLNNTQNMGAHHLQKMRFDTSCCGGFLNEQIK